MKALSVFSFQESRPVRVVLVEGEPWFVAADVCKALDIADNRAAVRKLDEDEKGGYSIPTLVVCSPLVLLTNPAFIPSSCAVVTR